ncbi:MAG: hypothetical protein Q8N04_00760, partial [Nitrospira sp.]|nr:hypothetical protein [Nitrospira sp.]
CVKTSRRMYFVKSKRRSKMRKAQQKPTGRQPKVNIGAELLSSVREMNCKVWGRCLTLHLVEYGKQSDQISVFFVSDTVMTKG